LGDSLTERARAVEAIAEEVETLWLSEAIRGTRPTVLDEVRHCLNVVEGSLLDIVPRVYRTVEASLRDAYPDREWRVPPFLRFGSWIGGDRDGHPGVSPRPTAEAIRLQAETLLRHYIERVDALWWRLSHSDRSMVLGQDLLASIAWSGERFAAAWNVYPPEGDGPGDDPSYSEVHIAAARATTRSAPPAARRRVASLAVRYGHRRSH
jgi:phosphoenolpyruvate carboxylase